MSVAERLMSHAHAPSLFDCWVWRGAWSQSRRHSRYGKIEVDGRTLGAHRVSYEVYVGPIPDGCEMDHVCRVTLCINPAHLRPVSPYQNKKLIRERMTQADADAMNAMLDG